MKKKIIFAAVTILVFAALAVAEALVLRARDPNPEFGMVRDVYTFSRPETQITDCEGDVDILRAESIVWDRMQYAMYDEAGVRLAASKDIAFTSALYKNGRAVGDEDSYPKSHVERLEDGEWVEYNDELAVDFTSLLMFGEPPYAGMGAGESVWTLFGIPVSDPGTYRCTLYFRESEAMEYYEYTTGDELYHITFTLTVPEATEKRFDVISTCLLYDPSNVAAMDFVLRSNDGTGICLDRAKATLEMQKDGEWQDVSDLVFRTEETAGSRYVSDVWTSGNKYFCQVLFEREAHKTMETEYPYRLTLEFCENDDGTGERFFLTVNLQFTY